MVYRQILVPDKKNHSIEMPTEFYGRKVEVVVTEVNDQKKPSQPIPPQGKTVSANDLLDSFGTAPDFPGIDEIRSKAWPSKW
jgi:hypothetical protein